MISRPALGGRQVGSGLIRGIACSPAAGRLLLLAALSVTLSGCLEYRIARWRAPAPELQERIFPSRTVRPAEEPFEFHRAPAERTDLDTVSVRIPGGDRIPWADYMETRQIRAFLVIRNDTILYERYREGFTESTRSGAYSVAKSFTSALLGIALAEGSIRSLEDSVTNHIPELAGSSDFDGVTLRHLLEMRSGFAYSRAMGSPLQQLRSDDARFYHTRDLHRELTRMRRAEPPGGDWDYRDSDTQLLAWVLERATGRSLAEQLEEGIWTRIGAEFPATWSLDREGGTEKAATGVNATARDYARFARLFLEGGSWEGEQVIPEEWVELSTTLDRSRRDAEVSTWWRMQHRAYWWIPMQDWDAHRDFFADGAKGQRLYVHPPSRTIIVQLANSDAQDFPYRRITHYLLGEPYEYPTIIRR